MYICIAYTIKGGCMAGRRDLKNYGFFWMDMAITGSARRMVARQDNDPSKDPKNMSSEELLQLFNMYNVAGDVYAGE